MACTTLKAYPPLGPVCHCAIAVNLQAISPKEPGQQVRWPTEQRKAAAAAYTSCFPQPAPKPSAAAAKAAKAAKAGAAGQGKSRRAPGKQAAGKHGAASTAAAAAAASRPAAKKPAAKKPAGAAQDAAGGAELFPDLHILCCQDPPQIHMQMPSWHETTGLLRSHGKQAAW